MRAKPVTDLTKNPARRCMPVGEWPQKHRAAWETAQRQGSDLLDEHGLASHWRPATCRKVASSYGRYLTFAALRGQIDPCGAPADLLDRDLLRAFIAELEQQVAPVTLGQRLTDLHEAFRVMAPEADLEFLRKAARRKAALARPSRNKASKIVHPRQILELGIQLMDKAEAFPESAIKRACRYRDGLLLAVVAVRPIRLGNLASICEDRHLIHDRRSYRLQFEGNETKNHRPIDRWLPAELTPYVDRYLSLHRPVLLNGRQDDALWISYQGGRLGERSIYELVCDMTEAKFGVRINPHLIRDCYVTTIAWFDPKHIRAASAVLAHFDPHTAERSYNQADMVSALGQYQDDIQARRRELVESRRTKPRKG